MNERTKKKGNKGIHTGELLRVIFNLLRIEMPSAISVES
jgi:hypothetical protein